MSRFSPLVRQKVGDWTFLSNMTEQLRSSFKLRHVWCRLRPSNRSHTRHLQRTAPITHCLPLLADKSYCTIDDSANLLQLSVGSCAVALVIPAPGARWARHLLRSYGCWDGGSSSYPAGNKPVDIQSTTHKIKVRFIVKQQTLHIHQNRPS